MAINKFTDLIDRGKPIPFYGDGSTERDYTYYTDIIKGVTASIDRDLGYEIINLGESQTTRLAELVAIIEDVVMTCADVSKARRLLDYAPSTTVEEGVEKFVEWYVGERDRKG